MTRLTFSRRTALFAGAALPLAGLAPRPALATAGMMGATTPTHHRFRLGGFEVTTLLAGTRASDKPQETFGTNASPEDFAALSAANFIPADKTQNFFTPTLVNTGAELVLTACPYCLTMIDDGTKTKNVDETVKTKDIAEVLLESVQ